jgi:ABC-type molybdate transport system ATPase subunit
MNKEIGKNIEAELNGNILTLKVDVSKTFGPSKSGKTTIIASSEGNQKVGEVTIGLNVYTKA